MAYPAPIPVIEKPDLSIIVPVFQESRTLPPLFLMLSKQEQVSFELLLADGGSSDDTVEKAVLLQKKYPFQTRVLNSKKGRGRQMNTAGNVAKADTLLFLHADSFFLSPLALFQGLRELENAMSASLARDIAGRFSLSFYHEAEYTLSEKLSLAYYYYENKAHLNRTECINGDQGILIEKSFWKKSGKFDETLPFLEDRSFATVVENKGSWLLLSPTIFTSSRRFFQEGLHQRQTLNSIIRNFHSAERTDFISALPEIYKNQDKTQKLKLNPFFRKIRSLFSELAVREQCRLWHQTGAYIAGNAWQIAFFLDIKKEFKNGGVRGRRRLLKFHEIFIQKVVSSPPAALITTCLVWGWFHFHYFNKKR